MVSKYPRKLTGLPDLSKASEEVRIQAIYDAHEEINYLKSQLKALDTFTIKAIGEINYRLKHI
jgi:hypothetical protein